MTIVTQDFTHSNETSDGLIEQKIFTPNDKLFLFGSPEGCISTVLQEFQSTNSKMNLFINISKSNLHPILGCRHISLSLL